MTLEPIQGARGGPGMPAATRLVSSRKALPSGTCIVRLAVEGARSEGLGLYASIGEEAEPALIHEFAVRPAGRVEHVVYLPREIRELVLRSAEGGPLPVISRFRVYQLGTVTLTGLLALRWAGRQVREPRRAGRKVANGFRVLRREGPRAVLQGLVASQAATQAADAASPWSSREDRYAYTGAWAEERYPPAPVSKAAVDRVWGRDLRSFLEAGERLRLPAAGDPSVSIILVTYNRAALSLASLRAIARHAPADAEVVVVDNASSDQTRMLLGRLDGARVLENDQNAGFLRACNQAVGVATGRSVLLVNNDALILPGSIQAALRMLRSDPSVGVVGGRLIGLDGRLQEAGSIVWGDGSCSGFGRGADPNAHEYRFRRDVDFVSGAFLLTRRRVWDRLGGFDEAFAPAYYEDVDYCLRAQAAGYQVVYEPEAAVVHYEYGSSSPAEAQVAMRHKREVFVSRHKEWLAGRPPPGAVPSHAAPGGPSVRRRVLMIDDRVPAATVGSGAPRTASLLRALVSLGWDVTFYPALPFTGTWQDVYRAVPPEAEVMLGWERQRLGRFLAERRGRYERLLVSRAHNMTLVNELVARDPDLLGGALVVYDSEAIGAFRAITAREALGNPLRPEEARRLVAQEIEVAVGAHRVIAVTPGEARTFERARVREVHLVSHGLEIRPTTRSFEARRNLLFVGRLSEQGSPNVDALAWFLDHVFPLLGDRLGEDCQLVVAGRLSSVTLPARAAPTVRFLGPIEDLRPLYEDARVFIAPHRFAAGAPFKVIEAAANGVPVAATDLLARQLEWIPGRDLLASAVGDAEAFAANCATLYSDERLWTAVRRAGLLRVGREASVEGLTRSVGRVMA